MTELTAMQQIAILLKGLTAAQLNAVYQKAMRLQLELEKAAANEFNVPNEVK